MERFNGRMVMNNMMKILSRVVLIGFICVLFSLCNSKEVKAADINYTCFEGGSFNGPGEANDNEVVTFAFTPPDGYYVHNADVEDLVHDEIACEIISGDSDRKSTVMFRFTVPANGTTINVGVSCTQRQNQRLTMGYANGGTTSPAAGEHQYLDYADVAITATPDPGNIFVHWTGIHNYGTVADSSSASTTLTMGNGPVNITAIFSTAPTITFNPNGGSVSPTYAQVGTDRKLASLPTATWAGHNCIGWFTQPAGGDEVTENTEFTSNTTIYAHWENATAAPTITTTSLPNGTVGEAYSQQLQASGGSGELSWEITSVTPPHFSLSSGGVLSGTPDSVGEYTFTVKVTDALNRSDTKNLTITIDPAAVTYTVTFNPNGTGATVNPTSGTTGTDGKLTSLPTPRWTGHSFTGWYTLATGGEEVTTNTVFSGNRTIYAHWSDSNTVNVNVTFKVKNGSWNDGTRANKTKNLWRYENQDLALQLTAADIPGVGNNPDSGYRAGSWDVEPPIGTNLSNESRNLTYTYTYAGSGSSGSKKSDDSDHYESSPAPAPKPVNPNSIISTSFSFKGAAVNSSFGKGEIKIGPQEQGTAAQLAFRLNTPAGWREAFSFNMTVKNMTTYEPKTGTLSFTIPTRYQKDGRKFAILGIDQYGKVKIFYDTDTTADTITVNLINFPGYAFDLIYCD